jgi:hypothetical protein
VATATKSKPETPSVPKVCTFYSRHGNLRLPRVKQHDRLGPLGDRYAHIFFTDENGREITRKVYEFERGQLTLTEGQDTYPDGPNGEMQDAVTWLRRHPEYNSRFHEEGREPGRPQPSDEDFLAAVTEAALNLDDEQITALLRQERATHQRPTLLKTADDARRRVLALKEQAQIPDEAA